MRFLIICVLASVLALATCEEYFAGIPITDLPSPGNRAAMARFVVTHANWTSFAYVSKKCGDGGCPGNAVFATSDGKYGAGSGVPYFFSSRHHPSIAELLDNDARGALAMSLAQTDICKEKGWDPQDPRCAHVVVKGNFVKLDEKDSEYTVGRSAMLTRHPQLEHYPPGHKWFIGKLKIQSIAIINTFGGPVDINLDEYFKVKC